MEEIREFFRGDRFATEQGMVIDEVDAENGRAVCSVEVREGHCNALGNVQGGLLFTLADFAFAVAGNCGAHTTVTLNSSIHYLRPSKGGRLFAAAQRVHQTRSTCIYQVEVTDDLGAHIARVTTTGFCKQKMQ